MKKSVFLIFLFIFFLFFPSLAKAAASLSLSPTTGGAAIGGTFNIEIKLNTGGAATTGVDGVVTYNPQVLEVTGFEYGTLYSGGQPNPTIDSTTGKIVFHPGVTSTIYAYTTSGTPGTLATITFKGKGAGTSQVAFTCNPGTTQGDTNVWSANQDIVSCAATTGGSYTVTSSGGSTGTTPTNTPTPTITSGSSSNTSYTSTPTPSQLPESGVMEWTVVIFALGIFFIFGGTKLLLIRNPNPQNPISENFPETNQ